MLSREPKSRVGFAGYPAGAGLPGMPNARGIHQAIDTQGCTPHTRQPASAALHVLQQAARNVCLQVICLPWPIVQGGQATAPLQAQRKLPWWHGDGSGGGRLVPAGELL